MKSDQPEGTPCPECGRGYIAGVAGYLPHKKNCSRRPKAKGEDRLVSLDDEIHPDS